MFYSNNYTMYAQFQKVECAKATAMDGDYKYRQDSIFFNRIDAMPTYMRCFKDPDLEQKMRTDAFKTRTYSQWDCAFADKKAGSSLDEAFEQSQVTQTATAAAPLYSTQTRNKVSMQ